MGQARDAFLPAATYTFRSFPHLITPKLPRAYAANGGCVSPQIATSCKEREMTVFVIADLHLGDDRLHRKARAQFATLREMEDEIAYRWNAVVQPRDTIYVLGDVGHVSSVEMIRELSGEKHLVAGNCDRLGRLIASRLFRSVTVAKWLPGALLTHIPVHASQLRGATVTVHGHLHSARLDDPRYRCVSVEQTDFSPVPLLMLLTP